MIRALARYLFAAHRLRAHQRRNGDLLDPDALQDRARALQRVAAGSACGMPVPRSGRYCTEVRGHDGPHRHFLSEHELPRCPAVLHDRWRCTMLPHHPGDHHGVHHDQRTGRPLSVVTWPPARA